MANGQSASERITQEATSWPGARPGFGARRIETETDVDDVIALLRLNYERVVARNALATEAAA